MGFGDDDDATDAERVELVEDHVDDSGLGPLCRFDQGALDRFQVVDGVRVAVEQLEEQVPSQRVQSTVPPLTDPAIYRTSLATSPHVAFWAAKKFFATDEICFTVGSVQPHCKKKTRPCLDFAAAQPRRDRDRASLTPPPSPSRRLAEPPSPSSARLIARAAPSPTLRPWLGGVSRCRGAGRRWLTVARAATAPVAAAPST